MFHGVLHPWVGLLSGAAAISLANVTAGYRRHQVLVDLDLEIQSGLTFVVGENGAGKTTLFRILLGLVQPTSGTVHLVGKELLRTSRPVVSRQIGYMPQSFRTPSHLRLCDFLAYMAALKLVPRREVAARAKTAAHRVGLEDHWRTPLGSLSGGMMRRAGIAQALVSDPTVILLDEPTVGLDPSSRVEFRQLVAELASSTTIVISTHLLEDATVLGGTLVALRRGRIAYTGSTEALIDRAGRQGSASGGTELESAFLSLISDPPS